MISNLKHYQLNLITGGAQSEEKPEEKVNAQKETLFSRLTRCAGGAMASHVYYFHVAKGHNLSEARLLDNEGYYRRYLIGEVIALSFGCITGAFFPTNGK